MADNKCNVTINGKKWTFLILSEEECPVLEDSNGVCFYDSKKIIINKDELMEAGDPFSEEDSLFAMLHVIKHEVIHAHLGVSGLRENSCSTIHWAENEEMIDFFATNGSSIEKVSNILKKFAIRYYTDTREELNNIKQEISDRT